MCSKLSHNLSGNGFALTFTVYSFKAWFTVTSITALALCARCVILTGATAALVHVAVPVCTMKQINVPLKMTV